MSSGSPPPAYPCHSSVRGAQSKPQSISIHRDVRAPVPVEVGLAARHRVLVRSREAWRGEDGHGPGVDLPAPIRDRPGRAGFPQSRGRLEGGHCAGVDREVGVVRLPYRSSCERRGTPILTPKGSRRGAQSSKVRLTSLMERVTPASDMSITAGSQRARPVARRRLPVRRGSRR